MKGRERPCDGEVSHPTGQDGQLDSDAEAAEDGEGSSVPPEDELVLDEAATANTGGAPLAWAQVTTIPSRSLNNSYIIFDLPKKAFYIIQ